MITSHLNLLHDAAITVDRLLRGADIKYGFFGGYAIASIGSPRATKDIDCLADCTKPEVLYLFTGAAGFTVVPQDREDYVAFLWANDDKSMNLVLVEVFCAQFPGSEFSMQNIPSYVVQVTGENLGHGLVVRLDLFHLFKGKLCATPSRSKYHDSADLMWLEGRYDDEFKPRASKLNLRDVGLTLARYPELTRTFEALGLDITWEKELVKDLNISQPDMGLVQERDYAEGSRERTRARKKTDHFD